MSQIQINKMTNNKGAMSSTCKVSAFYFVVFGGKLDRSGLSPSGTADGHLRVH